MDVLAAYAVLAVLIEKIIEHLRKGVPALDGTWVFVLSLGLGIATAFGTGLRVTESLVPGTEIAEWFDIFLTGVGLGAGAGFFADVTGRSGPDGYDDDPNAQ